MSNDNNNSDKINWWQVNEIVQGDVFFADNLKGEATRLRFTNLRPRVKIHGRLGEVIMACYERNQGFSLLHVYIEWPNKLIGIDDEIVMENLSTIRY